MACDDWVVMASPFKVRTGAPCWSAASIWQLISWPMRGGLVVGVRASDMSVIDGGM